MDIQGYETLLYAAIHGDSPKSRLRNLLLAVRNLLFVENIDSVAMWITSGKDEGAGVALVSLQNDDIKFSEGTNNTDNGGNVVKAEKPLETAYVIELHVPS